MGRIEKLTLSKQGSGRTIKPIRWCRNADAWFRCGRTPHDGATARNHEVAAHVAASLYFAPHAVPGFPGIHPLPVRLDLPVRDRLRVHGTVRALSAPRQPRARLGRGAADGAEVAVPSGLHRRGAGTHSRRQSHRAVEARLHLGDAGHRRGVSPPGVGAEARAAVATLCRLGHPAAACHRHRSRRRSQRRQPGDRTGPAATAGRRLDRDVPGRHPHAGRARPAAMASAARCWPPRPAS